MISGGSIAARPLLSMLRFVVRFHRKPNSQPISRS
jgi:hypothetical protein